MAHRRLAWLTRRPSLWSVLVPVVGLAAGVMFATSAQTARGTDLRSSATGLPDVIREQTRLHQQRDAELSHVRSQVDRLTAAAAPGDSRLRRLTQQADRLAPVAGTAAVSGPALTVSLEDSSLTSDRLPAGMTVDDIVVHQQDVQAVVNALWAGGAEAMMLMDQRVVSTSAVRCVGNTLILQGRVYSPPYVISAIGDTARMKQALQRSPQVQIYRQYVDAVGLGYDVMVEANASFPAYAGSVQLRYATAVTP